MGVEFGVFSAESEVFEVRRLDGSTLDVLSEGVVTKLMEIKSLVVEKGK